MDYASLFTTWAAPAAAADGAVTSIQGLLVAGHVQGDRARLQLRVPEGHVVSALVSHGVVSLSVPSTALAVVDVLDEVRVVDCVERTAADGRVFLNATTVVRATPWTHLDTNEPVPMPLPVDGKGPVFLIRWATGGTATAPGVHRVLATWELVPNVTDRRLRTTLVHRQWVTLKEAPDAQPLTLSLTLWDNFCRQLPGDGLTPDLALWKRVMPHHVVPFTAACCVDARFCKPGVSALSILGIQWELQAYLEEKCTTVALKDMQDLFPSRKAAAAAAPTTTTLLVITGQLPADPTQWRYYAMAVPSVVLNRDNAIFVAVRRPAAPAAPAPIKRRKKPQVEEEQEEQEEIN